jgi:hypothetical protein
VTAEGGHYAWTVTESNPVKPRLSICTWRGQCSTQRFMSGRVIFVHGLLGAAHTGGVSIRPSESFAGGIGVGARLQTQSSPGATRVWRRYRLFLHIATVSARRLATSALQCARLDWRNVQILSRTACQSLQAAKLYFRHAGRQRDCHPFSNEAENIPRLIESLLRQTPGAAEIIIVDGGSTDGTWEWLRDTAASHPTLRAIRDETCSLKFTPGPIFEGPQC